MTVFAHDNTDVNENLKCALRTVENIVGKGENAGNQHFLLYPQCFQKASFLGVIKNVDCVVKDSVFFLFFFLIACGILHDFKGKKNVDIHYKCLTQMPTKHKNKQLHKHTHRHK